MAWSEAEAIQAGELLCIKSTGYKLEAGKIYPVIPVNVGYGVVIKDGFIAGLSALCKYYNTHFEIKTIQLEND